MKFLKKSIYALSMMSMLALWSCSSEDLAGGEQQLAGHPVAVTLTVSRDDAGTRTAFTENNKTGGLTDVWVEGDKLAVYNSDGVKAGELTITEGAGTSIGVFSGEVTAEDGQQNFNLWYYDNVESNPNLSLNNSKTKLTVDLHSQSFADVAALSRMNILSKVVKLSVKENNATVVNDETMKTHLAFVRFSLTGLPAGAKGTLNICDLNGYGNNEDTGEEYYNTRNTTTFTFSRPNTPAATSTDKQDMVVKNVEAGKDVYAVLIPKESYKFSLTFNATDGKTYKYEFANSVNIEAGKYYTAFDKEEGAENGTFAGVQIPLEEVVTVDHSKNPLAKWADSDLKRSGSGASVTGVFTGDYNITGSYYQFGRNYGYNSASDVTLLSTEMNLSNNYFTYRGTKYTSTPENGVYSASSKKVQKNQNATSITNISDHPDMFLMNAGDYVTPGYTESWETRAKTNGYTRDNPCPEGWRIPSKSDFEEILPSMNNQVGSTSWNTLTQVKFIGEDEIPCAFRWSKDGNALKIECLVMASKDETPNWNDLNVQVRYFKLSGCLTSFMQSGNLTSGSTSTVQYVANVLDFGTYDTQRTLGTTSGWTNIYYMKLYKTADYMTDTGFYWTNDADQQVFTLNTNSSINSYPKVGYYFTKSSVTIGANIRCIKK